MVQTRKNRDKQILVKVQGRGLCHGEKTQYNQPKSYHRPLTTPNKLNLNNNLLLQQIFSKTSAVLFGRNHAWPLWCWPSFLEG